MKIPDLKAVKDSSLIYSSKGQQDHRITCWILAIHFYALRCVQDAPFWKREKFDLLETRTQNLQLRGWRLIHHYHEEDARQRCSLHKKKVFKNLQTGANKRQNRHLKKTSTSMRQGNCWAKGLVFVKWFWTDDETTMAQFF